MELNFQFFYLLSDTMLKQILRDMYVDPEILAGLDETQKQTLFCKMREEQIRRWTIWDKQAEEKRAQDNNKKQSTKKVDFLMGEDDEPWVWVMGEHPNDKTIEQILDAEAQEKARELAVIEAKELRKSVEAEMLCEIIECEEQNQKKLSDDEETPQIDEMEIYCSVDELRERMNQTKPMPIPQQNINTIKNLQNIYGNRVLTNFNFSAQDDKKNVLKVSQVEAVFEFIFELTLKFILGNIIEQSTTSKSISTSCHVGTKSNWRKNK